MAEALFSSGGAGTVESSAAPRRTYIPTTPIAATPATSAAWTVPILEGVGDTSAGGDIEGESGDGDGGSGHGDGGGRTGSNRPPMGMPFSSRRSASRFGGSGGGVGHGGDGGSGAPGLGGGGKGSGGDGSGDVGGGELGGGHLKHGTIPFCASAQPAHCGLSHVQWLHQPSQDCWHSSDLGSDWSMQGCASC